MTVYSPDPLAVLADPASSLSKVMIAAEEAEKATGLHEAKIGLSSNVNVELLSVFLRRHALIRNTRLRVYQGNFDDPLGDLERFAREEVNDVVFLPFFDNLYPSFEAQVGHLSSMALAEREADFVARFNMIFERASAFRTLFVGTLHRMSPVRQASEPVSTAIERFNESLNKCAALHSNVRVIDLAAVAGDIGRLHSFDLRFYFRAKTPYTTAFFDRLGRWLANATRGFGTYYYKALVLDCDNTLWGGVIGEDLLDGIRLGPHDYPGNIFWRVQHELVALEKAGVLLCLCTKNNSADVEEVLTQHPEMVLENRHLILKRVNWEDKSANLRSIAETLNIGLDSLVFLDDSAFECDGVRSQLPMVRVFQVPAQLSDYPLLIEEIKDLFLAGEVSAESLSKTEQYRQRALAEDARGAFASNEEFLASLNLRVEVTRDHRSSVTRISELTQKSNQFNLTTRRYGVAEIEQLIDAADATVYSISVSDKHGAAGLTGVLIMRWRDEMAVVDSFLMSCRVIGRGIEFSVWNEVARDARARGCTVLIAEYRPTSKNQQVADFFDRLGLSVVEEQDGVRHYSQQIDHLECPRVPWLEVASA